MNHAVTDAGKSNFATDMRGAPVVDRTHRANVIMPGYRPVNQLATRAIGDLDARYSAAFSADAIHLSVCAGRKRSVALSEKHRELDARRAGIDDQKGVRQDLVSLQWRASNTTMAYEPSRARVLSARRVSLHRNCRVKRGSDFGDMI